MKSVAVALAASMACALLSACVTVTAAPGADLVKLTRVPADVAACKAVGNIELTREDIGSGLDVQPAMRNKAVGLGANAVLITTPAGLSGVAYHCG
jgi:hypothetical protein